MVLATQRTGVMQEMTERDRIEGEAVALSSAELEATVDPNDPYRRYVTSSGTGYAESWGNMMTNSVGRVNTLTDIQGYLADLIRQSESLSVAISTFVCDAFEGIFASPSNGFTRADVTHNDVHALTVNVCSRHLLGALSEAYTERRFPGDVQPEQDGDESRGIDRRMEFDVTVQAKASWDSFPTPAASAIREADVLVAIRVDSETLDCSMRIVATA